MTSERPYQSAVSVPEALVELRRCAGTQFDPELVEAFCGLIQDGAGVAKTRPLVRSDPS